MKIKKKTLLLKIIFISFFLFSGCGSILSDNGSESQSQIEKEAYLATEVLDEDYEKGEEASQNAVEKYETYVLERGDFTIECQNKRAEIVVPVSHKIKVKDDTDEMIFEKFAVVEDSFINEGDTVAYVSVSVDEVKIKEKEISIEKLENEYAYALEDREETLKSREGPFYISEGDRKVMELNWQIEDLRWEQQNKNYINSIADAKEELEKLKSAAAITQIKADCSGYISSLEKIKIGDKLSKGTILATIVPSEDIYVSVSSSDSSFSYGESVTFVTRSRSKKETEYEAYVVSADENTLYCGLRESRVYLKVDLKYKDLIKWDSASIKGTLSFMKNVITVPKEAVTQKDLYSYVTILKDDGTLETVPFIEGGSNTKYVWSIMGLEEGMRVVIK